jgi:hypothetical protein
MLNNKKRRIMARVIFKEGQPIQSLSGAYGNMIFKQIHGETRVYRKPEPQLPKRATKEQKEKYKKQVMVNECMKIIQGEMPNMERAILLRETIRKRLQYLYKQYAGQYRSRLKLQAAIMSAYYAKAEKPR